MSASGDQWYVRNGKKVQGPFTAEQVRGFKERGRLTDAHELSQDRANWQPALASSLFGALPAGGDGQGYALQQSPAAHMPTGAPGDGLAWFYAVGQEQCGPVETQQLKQLLSRGAVGPESLVWRDGLPNWIPARDVPEFAGLTGRGGSGEYAGAAGGGPVAAERFTSPGMTGVPRTAESVAILSLFTLGFYLFVWYFATRKELCAAGAKVPPAWQLFIPFWNLYWYWTWAAGAQIGTRGGLAAPLVFLTWLGQAILFLPTMGIASAIWAGWIQSKLNAAGCN